MGKYKAVLNRFSYAKVNIIFSTLNEKFRLRVVCDALKSFLWRVPHNMPRYRVSLGNVVFTVRIHSCWKVMSFSVVSVCLFTGGLGGYQSYCTMAPHGPGQGAELSSCSSPTPPPPPARKDQGKDWTKPLPPTQARRRRSIGIWAVDLRLKGFFGLHSTVVSADRLQLNFHSKKRFFPAQQLFFKRNISSWLIV